MMRSIYQMTFSMVLALGFASAGISEDINVTSADLNLPWKNIGPLESNGVQAFIDYQLKRSIPEGDVWGGKEPKGGPGSFQTDAEPVWVNIKRVDLTSSDYVYVQLITYEDRCYRGECVYFHQTIDSRNLEFAEAGRFSGKMQTVNLSYQLNDGYGLRRHKLIKQELVIWINGELFKDANGSNLSFLMKD